MEHEISSHALRSLQQRKFNKLVVLLLAEDVKLFHNHPVTEAASARLSLCRDPTISACSELCQITLMHVAIFNRHHADEAQRMLLSAYTKDSDENVNEDIRSCLSQVLQGLCILKENMERKYRCC